MEETINRVETLDQEKLLYQVLPNRLIYLPLITIPFLILSLIIVYLLKLFVGFELWYCVPIIAVALAGLTYVLKPSYFDYRQGVSIAGDRSFLYVKISDYERGFYEIPWPDILKFEERVSTGGGSDGLVKYVHIILHSGQEVAGGVNMEKCTDVIKELEILKNKCS